MVVGTTLVVVLLEVDADADNVDVTRVVLLEVVELRDAVVEVKVVDEEELGGFTTPPGPATDVVRDPFSI